MAEKELKNLLNPCSDGDLGEIVRRARALGELTEVLAGGLAEEFRGSIVAANLRDDGELVVIAASSAWANRLRYETDTLMAVASDKGLKVTNCRIRVRSG